MPDSTRNADLNTLGFHLDVMNAYVQELNYSERTEWLTRDSELVTTIESVAHCLTLINKVLQATPEPPEGGSGTGITLYPCSCSICTKPCNLLTRTPHGPCKSCAANCHIGGPTCPRNIATNRSLCMEGYPKGYPQCSNPYPRQPYEEQATFPAPPEGGSGTERLSHLGYAATFTSGPASYRSVRLGHCPSCSAAFHWNSHNKRLPNSFHNAQCPGCGGPLARTTSTQKRRPWYKLSPFPPAPPEGGSGINPRQCSWRNCLDSGTEMIGFWLADHGFTMHLCISHLEALEILGAKNETIRNAIDWDWTRTGEQGPQSAQ